MAIEPLYSLEVAAELIPISKDALVHIILRHPEKFDEPLYHTLPENNKGSNIVRMLTERECLVVRDMIIARGRRGVGGKGASRRIEGVGFGRRTRHLNVQIVNNYGE